MKLHTFLLTAGIIASPLTTATFAQETSSQTSQVVLESEGTVSVRLNGEDLVAKDAGQNDQDGTVVVEVHSTSTSENSDGQKPQAKVSGKVIVIDKDGKRKVYDFDQNAGRMVQKAATDAAGKMSGLVTVDVAIKGDNSETDQSEVAVTVDDQEERWVIGVQCEEASELLRDHLKLGSKGLVILDVREETPAKEAGLKVNDIIVSINDRELESRDALIDTVLSSEGAAMKLSIIRSGDVQTVEVTPRKMKTPVVMAPAWMELEIGDVVANEVMDPAQIETRIRRIHPGVLIEGGVVGESGDINEVLQKVRVLARNQGNPAIGQSRIIITGPGALNSAPNADLLKKSDSIEKTISTLQEQIKALQQQVQELQKQVKAEN